MILELSAIVALIFIIVWLFGVRLLSIVDTSGRVIFHGDDDKKKQMVITIDDVPWKYSIPNRLKKELKQEEDLLTTSISEICKVLKSCGGCATLMMIGNYTTRNLQHNKALLEEFIEYLDEGLIQLANHGMTNSKHAKLSAEDMKVEITRCEKTVNQVLLEQLNHRRTMKNQETFQSTMQPFYRPGHGFFNKTMLDVCSELGYRVVLGNIYPHDPFILVWWLNLLNIVIMTYVYDILKWTSFGFLASNDGQQIVILHDRPWTAKLLSYLIPFLKWRGYDIVHLSDVIRK